MEQLTGARVAARSTRDGFRRSTRLRPRYNRRSEALQPPGAFISGPVADFLLHTAQDAAVSVAQEVMLESTLHITAVTAGQCMELYGPAPAVLANDDPIDEQELLDALPRHLRQQVVAQENSDRKELAACLATPAEPVENNRVVRGSAVQRLLGYNGERTREAGLYEVYNSGGSLQWSREQLRELIDGQQRVAAAARRQRRRTLLRLLRISKQTMASLVSLTAST